MGDVMLWLLQTGFATYVAWRFTMLLGVNNPLMGIMLAIVLCIAAPFGLDALLAMFEDHGSFTDVVVIARNLQIAAPLAFALIGVFMWSQIENITGW